MKVTTIPPKKWTAYPVISAPQFIAIQTRCESNILSRIHTCLVCMSWLGIALAVGAILLIWIPPPHTFNTPAHRLDATIAHADLFAFRILETMMALGLFFLSAIHLWSAPSHLLHCLVEECVLQTQFLLTGIVVTSNQLFGRRYTTTYIILQNIIGGVEWMSELRQFHAFQCRVCSVNSCRCPTPFLITVVAASLATGMQASLDTPTRARWIALSGTVIICGSVVYMCRGHFSDVKDGSSIRYRTIDLLCTALQGGFIAPFIVTFFHSKRGKWFASAWSIVMYALYRIVMLCISKWGGAWCGEGCWGGMRRFRRRKMMRVPSTKQHQATGQRTWRVC